MRKPKAHQSLNNYNKIHKLQLFTSTNKWACNWLQTTTLIFDFKYIMNGLLLNLDNSKQQHINYDYPYIYIKFNDKEFRMIKNTIDTQVQNKKYASKQQIGGYGTLNNQNDPKKTMQILTTSCPKHPTEYLTNYCSNMKCLIPLCPDCIQSHLQHHRHLRTQQEVESMKAIRVKCIQKLQRLIQFYKNEMMELQFPKSVQQLLTETSTKIKQIKEFIFETLDQYFRQLDDDTESRIRDSQQIINKVQKSHQAMRIKVQNLEHDCQILRINHPLTATKVKQIMEIDSTYQHIKFNGLIQQYNKYQAKTDILVSFDHKKFVDNFEQCLKIQLQGHPQKLQNFMILEESIKYINLPIIHYFEIGTSNLHIIELPRQNKKKIGLSSQWVVPERHNSLLLSNGDIWLSGGIYPNITFNSYVCKFDTKKVMFDTKFIKILDRCHHSMVELSSFVYIMGGFKRKSEDNPDLIQQFSMQRISMQNFQVVRMKDCKYGGESISLPFLQKNSIFKISVDGLEIYSVTLGYWSQVHIPNYYFNPSCAAVNANDSYIFVFGGYVIQNSQKVPTKQSHIIDISDLNCVTIINRGTFDLLIGGGFQNNVPIFFKKNIYTLQNNEDSEIDDGIRTLFKFDGKRWQLIEK